MNVKKQEDNLSIVNALKESSQQTFSTDLSDCLLKTLNMSSFVADVYNVQAEKSLQQLIWHEQYSAVEFVKHLQIIIGSTLFVKDFKYQHGIIPPLNCFSSKLQSEDAMMSFLRKIRRQHSAAIAVLELSGRLSIDESMLRMSILAEELTQTAYLWSYANHQETFGSPYSNNQQTIVSDKAKFSTAKLSTKNDSTEKGSTEKVKTKQQNLLILAMGKLGGKELNFSSDIDLIFFYPSDGETQGGRRTIENSRFFQKVGVQLIKLLNEATEDGFVFRVDMRLRPYGDSGSLVISVEQAEDYYHEQGRGWERFAMVRAAIISGRPEEQQALASILTPFAFRRYIDYGVIDSLRNMKAMIQREVLRRGLVGNIKLGAGGIREIEFMVQSLQLIQGGRNKQLQEKSVLKVLPLLASEKLLTKEVSLELASRYRFLRRLEHCIQELDEKQTQQLPEDNETQQVIAQVMGFSNWKIFNQHLQSIQSHINQLFIGLFGDEKSQDEQRDDFYFSLWEGHISQQQLLEKCSNINEKQADNIIVLLNEFTESSIVRNLSARGAKRLKIFFPNLLAIALIVEDPIQTLERLVFILKAILKRTAYLDLLSENQPVLQNLVDLVSQSDWIVHRLSECPILLDELLYPNSLYEPLQTSDLNSELQQSLLRIDEKDEEQILDTIRQFKQINELRVAAALLSNQLNIAQASRYLSQLAQVIIQAAVNQCWRVVTSQYGFPEALLNNIETDDLNKQKGFCVVAYGKLGGQELGFNSDLDIVFLFNQHPSGITVSNKQSNNQSIRSLNVNRFYTRLAQKIIHFLSTRTSLGVLYEVDMRLRPSGNSGMLVSHIDSFEEYQNENAWTWEHQALVRARVVVGDEKIIQQFEKVRSKILSKERDNDSLKKDVAEMRLKMRQQLEQSKEDKIDLKQCVGGLVDIEFIAQYLMLKLTEDVKYPSNTVEALKLSKKTQQLENVKVDLLIDSYRDYSNHLNKLALVSGKKLICSTLFSEQRKNIKEIWDNLFL